MNVNPRKIAVDMVYNIGKGHNFSTEIEKLRSKNDFSDLDIRFTSEIVSGTLRKREFIDFAISVASNIKPNKISPYVLAVLRCGVYQILFMDKVPESAAVNESVKLIKKSGNQRLCGYVNAVLHKAAKNGLNIKLPTEKNEMLSVKYSCPLWITKIFNESLGDEAELLLKSLGEKSDTVLRANTLKTSADELVDSLCAKGWKCKKYSSELFPKIDTLIHASKIDGLTEAQEFKDGMFYVQDAAAAFAAYVLSPKCHSTVIDMCAAPGGKTTYLAEIMKNTGKIYAFDIYDKKIDKINENAERLGLSNIIAKKQNAAEYDIKFKETADRILVDSPCSGFGIIRKKPDIKYLRRSEDIKELAAISIKILLNAAEYLKKGGMMVFSTCTLTEEENTGVLFEFLSKRRDFRLKKIPCSRENDGYITLYPHKDNCDGFFISLLEKE